MQNQKQQAGNKLQRGGDTSRSSSQGRKLSSGGKISTDRKGNPEMDDDTKSPKAGNKNKKMRRS